MKKYDIKRIFLFLLLSLPFSQSLAEEKIVGGFGINLGQSFDPSTAIGKTSLTDGTPMYQLNPEKKFRSFSDYYVLITPKSNQIYSIWGIGSIKNSSTCKKELKLLMAILKDKYGKEDDKGPLSSLSDSEIITQGDKYVMTKCSGYSNVTVEIRYQDTKYAELAENERIELESKELDSSGL